MPHKYQFVSKYPADYHWLRFNDIAPLISPKSDLFSDFSCSVQSRARLIFYDGGIGTAKIPAERLKSFCTHIKKVKKNPNDRMLDKSGEFFLKPCVSIMHIVFDFRRVQLVGSIKVYSSH